MQICTVCVHFCDVDSSLRTSWEFFARVIVASVVAPVFHANGSKDGIGDVYTSQVPHLTAGEAV